MSIFNINTNLNAMNALYNLNSNGMNMSTSIQRLSTGLQINSAADNPAGLVISKQFQSQITAIQAAIGNSQDALNLTKTAEGALNEVNNLLNTARGLAVQASNSGVASSDQLQADQSQLQAIANSITRISQTTQFDNKNLLDGSVGVTAALTNSADVSAITLSGNFGGSPLTANSPVTMTVTTPATTANLTLSKTFATSASTVGVGQFAINGTTFNTTGATTVADVLNEINSSSNTTGVQATYTTGGAISLTSTTYGANAKIDISDANGTITAGHSYVTGTNAAANVNINGTNVVFTGGQQGNDGLTLTDTSGNKIVLTSAGNATVAATNIGQVSVGNAQFQIGGNVGQTTNLSIGNFAANQLGGGVVPGLTLANLDLTSFTGAQNAMTVIDQAIKQVSDSRGAIGAFQADTLQSNMNTLNVTDQNLSASLSSIQDTNVAQEMTNFTKYQILQSAGISVLAQANQAPQAVLKLLG